MAKTLADDRLNTDRRAVVVASISVHDHDQEGNCRFHGHQFWASPAALLGSGGTQLDPDEEPAFAGKIIHLCGLCAGQAAHRAKDMIATISNAATTGAEAMHYQDRLSDLYRQGVTQAVDNGNLSTGIGNTYEEATDDAERKARERKDQPPPGPPPEFNSDIFGPGIG